MVAFTCSIPCVTLSGSTDSGASLQNGIPKKKSKKQKQKDAAAPAEPAKVKRETKEPKRKKGEADAAAAGAEPGGLRAPAADGSMADGQQRAAMTNGDATVDASSKEGKLKKKKSKKQAETVAERGMAASH